MIGEPTVNKRIADSSGWLTKTSRTFFVLRGTLSPGCAAAYLGSASDISKLCRSSAFCGLCRHIVGRCCANPEHSRVNKRQADDLQCRTAIHPAADSVGLDIFFLKFGRPDIRLVDVTDMAWGRNSVSWCSFRNVHDRWAPRQF